MPEPINTFPLLSCAEIFADGPPSTFPVHFWNEWCDKLDLEEPTITKLEGSLVAASSLTGTMVLVSSLTGSSIMSRLAGTQVAQTELQASKIDRTSLKGVF